MDEEKKKYLEELRKQVDPEVLAKMADYLGAGDGSTHTSPDGSSDSAAEAIRQRREQKFQERVARKKRESQMHGVTRKVEDPLANRTLLILSGTEIWSRIVESQFRLLGFPNSEVFTEFNDLIRYVMEALKDGTSKDFIVAVALREIRQFLFSWGSIREGLIGQQKEPFVDDIAYFLVVESPKQVQAQLVRIIGENYIICLTDELDLNRQKIERGIALVHT